MKISSTFYNSPLGQIKITASSNGITSLQFTQEKTTAENENLSSILQECTKQLDEYFNQKRTEFSLPLDVSQATPFYKSVWKILQEIPGGETRTYSQVAAMLGKPKGARAVGTANGKNPIAIIIPCHRLIGRDGKLRGYAYGVEKKAALLELEGKHVLGT